MTRKSRSLIDCVEGSGSNPADEAFAFLGCLHTHARRFDVERKPGNPLGESVGWSDENAVVGGRRVREAQGIYGRTIVSRTPCHHRDKSMSCWIRCAHGGSPCWLHCV